jgi:putative membrane protein
MTQTARMSEADHERVSAAVRAAETGTAGEIVTIVTEASDRYLDVALWWSIFAAMLALAALAITPDFYTGLFDRLTNSWVSDWTSREYFELAVAVAVVKFAAVRLILQWTPLRLFLTPRIVRQSRVRGRAIRYFKVGAERRTQGRTGILIYLSMAEHIAEIVADEAIHTKVPAEIWGEAMAHLIAEVRVGRVAAGMVAAIDDVGAILATHVPRATVDVNELPDRLIEI